MIDASKVFQKVTNTINDFSHDKLEGLTNIIKHYRDEKVDFKKNDWLKKNFSNNKYEDIEGLCKIVDKKEIIENDYSFTPGRYVGYTHIFEENFDYKVEIKKIHNELSELELQNKELLDKILKVKI